MLLVILSFITASVYRVRIKNLLNNEYLLRRVDDIGLTKNKNAPKTDFFIEIPDTLGNIKDVVLFEHVIKKYPRYLFYEKANNRLAFHDKISKLRFSYNKGILQIKMINSEECLHIEGGTILLRNCNSNLKNQQFTLHELKKRKVERRLKDNTKMEIEVEGRDKKIKDKSIHDDNIYIKYNDDGEVYSTEEDINHIFEDGKTIDIITEQNTNQGNVSVSQEVKNEIQEEPALLVKENVSNIIHSTLYTTMIVNSTATVYTTVFHTITSSILSNQTETVYVTPNLTDKLLQNTVIMPKSDENIASVATIPENQYYRSRKRISQKKKNEDSITQHELFPQNDSDEHQLTDSVTSFPKEISTIGNEIEESPEYGSIYNRDADYFELKAKNNCFNNNSPECKRFNESYNRKSRLAKIKERILKRAKYFNQKRLLQGTNSADFDVNSSKNNILNNSRFGLLTENTNDEQNMHNLARNKTFNNMKSSLFGESTNPVLYPQNSQYFDGNNGMQLNRQRDGLSESVLENNFLPQQQINEELSAQKVSHSGGLLDYVGFNDSIGDGFANLNENTIYSGISLNI
ncbi:hypothetical protein NCER_100532 [Vairimorpha ceranae BRL01]|uniref:Uncharacterized protein n=2 Tax=Vairimorpha ceranae TaxID=40302 RepID=C4V7U1_VAIC1|nr:hypothetical protein AAJ76_710005614 [Vairimorpha ceranae]EEQ82715.1 hypothetical protein NCER_100532 [Vairimorpha ceranae BRL01]KAF5139908.1 hypothetical protein G9O61_00g019270 [Vairimorpha ceranae]KKO74441.1 hypothetical protein AAJ76_710005614 [Vairimorpha ceranae]